MATLEWTNPQFAAFMTADLNPGQNPEFGYISATSFNVCGNGTGFLDLEVANLRGTSQSSLVYPNPVNDVLTVEINVPNSVGISSTATSYDLRLYDSQGNLLRQQFTAGGTVQFNVSGLPEGIYYLHIFDGVSATPEIHQIIVER